MIICKGTVVYVRQQTCMTSEFPADRIKYYEGWATFFKQLSACGGSIVLLPAAGVEPPPKVKVIMFNKGKVRAASYGIARIPVARWAMSR